MCIPILYKHKVICLIKQIWVCSDLLKSNKKLQRRTFLLYSSNFHYISFLSLSFLHFLLFCKLLFQAAVKLHILKLTLYINALQFNVSGGQKILSQKLKINLQKQTKIFARHYFATIFCHIYFFHHLTLSMAITISDRHTQPCNNSQYIWGNIQLLSHRKYYYPCKYLFNGQD